MAQNRSSAVMQQRVEPHDSLDDFPTPPWATRALCEWLLERYRLASMTCREPCANRGFMVAPLREFFCDVLASDVFDYGAGFPVVDYLFGPAEQLDRTDITVANPPFRLAQQFIERAVAISDHCVAMLVRSSFSEGQDRFAEIFSKFPPSFELVFSERVVMLKGRLIRAGAPDPFSLDADGKPRKASTATSVVWLVWLRGDDGEWIHDTRKRWIPPCRLALEKPGDYPVYDLELM